MLERICCDRKEGRKNSLSSIHRKLLQDHKDLYRIKNDDEVLKDIHEYIEEDVDDIEKLKETLKKFQRQRHLMM